MRLDASIPRTRKAAKVRFVMRAMMNSPRGREKRAAKLARKLFKTLHPKGSTTWVAA